MAREKEKKGYKGYKMDNDNDEGRKARAKKNAAKTERQTNEMFALDNPEFQQACTAAGIPPTPRQASKWRNGYGKAAQAAGKSVRS